MGWFVNSKKNKGNYQDIQSHQGLVDPIDVLNNKLEYQECTCKMDKSLNRGMFNKFESRKISVAGYQCDNSDFDFCFAEH